VSELQVTLSPEQIEAIAEALAQRLALSGERRSPWVTMRELADYLGWGLASVKRESARDAIPGKSRHEGKVRFHLPTVDAWLLNECPHDFGNLS
jgi:hypothetical protein